MKTLFVGGPEDGRRMEKDWQFSSQLLVPVWDRYIGGESGSDLPFKTETYTLKRFSGEGKTYEVAFHSSVKNPMEAIIKGYHYHRRPRYGRRRIPKIP